MTFDLQAARAICDKLTPGKDAIDIDYQNALAAEMLPAVLDEIERLRKIEQIEYPNALCDVKNLEEQIDTWHLRRENELRQWNELSQHSKMQTNRIAELEAALVEERARRICHTPTDAVGHWPGYEQVVVDEAKLQLHAERTI